MVGKKQDEALGSLEQGFQDISNGKIEAALVTCQEALKIYRKIDDRIGEACALNNIGIVHQFQTADFYRQAATTFRELKSNGLGVVEEQLEAVTKQFAQFAWLSPSSSENGILITRLQIAGDVTSQPPLLDPGTGERGEPMPA